MNYLTRLALTLLLCLPILVSGCDDHKKSTEQPKVMIMLTSADYPPFAFYDTSPHGAEVIGFEVDLAKRIGEYLGFEVEVQDVDFAGIIPGLQSGRADFAMAALSLTKERQKNIDFSEGYYFANNVIVTRKDSNFMHRKNFLEVKVGVQLGSTQEAFAKIWIQRRKGLELVLLNRVNHLIQEVIAKRLDAVIIEKTPAVAYVEKNSDVLELFHLQGKGEAYAIGFAKGSPHVDRFNQALKHLREIGYLDELVQKWLKNF